MFSFVAAGVSGFRFFRVWGFRVSMLFSVVAQGFCGFGLDLGFLHFNLRVWVGTTKSQDLKDGWMDGWDGTQGTAARGLPSRPPSEGASSSATLA